MNDSNFRFNLKQGWATLIIAAVIFVLAFGVVAWRLDQAPDVFTDEILYTRIGTRIANEGALVWDSGLPVYVHPPLYFLVEGVYQRLTSDTTNVFYDAGDIFAWVYHARYLNAILAGLTAVLLFLFGKRIRGLRLGLLFATLFILDPFGLRTNRRAMLETMAVLVSLAGMAVLVTEKVKTGSRPSMVRALVAGVLLGAGLLTKELTFTALLAVLIFGLWELGTHHRSSAATPVFLTALIAGLTYSTYPIWVLASGEWQGFLGVKWLTLKRLVGLVPLSGWNRPGVTLTEFVSQRLADYGTTYLVLALGGLATLWLLLMHRHERSGRLLGIWGLILYPFYGFVALFGAGNDQFFYFLLIPAIVFIGYTASVMPEDMAAFLARHRQVNPGGQRNTAPWLSWSRTCALLALLTFMLPYNLTRWWVAFGTGQDNSYYQLAHYVQDQLPARAPIGTSGDPTKFRYFFEDRPIVTAATPHDALTAGVHYFALAPKDVWAHYSQITPELATWIAEQGNLLYSTSGNSYGDIYLYQLNVENSGPLVASQPSNFNISRQSFQPAKGGFVAGFALILLGWCAFVFGMTFGVIVGPKVLSRPVPPRQHHTRMEQGTAQRPLEAKGGRA